MFWAFWDDAEGAGILTKFDFLRNNVNIHNILKYHNWYFKANQNLSIVDECYASVTQVNSFLLQITENFYRRYQTK